MKVYYLIPLEGSYGRQRRLGNFKSYEDAKKDIIESLKYKETKEGFYRWVGDSSLWDLVDEDILEKNQKFFINL